MTGVVVDRLGESAGPRTARRRSAEKIARPCAPFVPDAVAELARTRSRSARSDSFCSWVRRSDSSRTRRPRGRGSSAPRSPRRRRGELARVEVDEEGEHLPVADAGFGQLRRRSRVMSLACMPAGYPAYPHVRRAAAASSRRAVFDPERRSSQGGWGAARPGTGRARCEGSFFSAGAVLCLAAPAVATAAPELTTTQRLNDKRFVVSGSRAYDIGTEAGRYPGRWVSTRAGRWAASGCPRSSSWTASGSASTASGSAPRPARSRAAGATQDAPAGHRRP